MKLLDNQFIRFLLVGCLNTLFGYSVFVLFLFLKFHYSIAAFISTVLGVLFNFKTIGGLVFKKKQNSLIIKFASVYVLSYLVNLGCLKIFAYFKVNMYLAGAVLVLPMALFSYLLNKKLVFKGEI